MRKSRDLNYFEHILNFSLILKKVRLITVDNIS